MTGQGTLSIRDLAVPTADPMALAAVLADTTAGQPPDERRTSQMFDRALQRAPLRLEQCGDRARHRQRAGAVSPARAEVPLPSGVVRAAFGGTFDMSRLLMDVTLSLETGEAGSAEAGGTIQWRGPAAAPERRVTAVALANAIAMRAIERENPPAGGTPRHPAGAAPCKPHKRAAPPVPSAPSAGVSTAPAPVPVPPLPSRPRRARRRRGHRHDLPRLPFPRWRRRRRSRPMHGRSRCGPNWTKFPITAPAARLRHLLPPPGLVPGE